MKQHKHIDEEWIKSVLHTRSNRERFADALSGPAAVASRSNKGEKNGAADSKGREPVYYVYGLFDKAQWFSATSYGAHRHRTRNGQAGL